MQTGRRYFQIEIVAQPFLELFDEEYASLGIEFANPEGRRDLRPIPLVIRVSAEELQREAYTKVSPTGY